MSKGKRKPLALKIADGDFEKDPQRRPKNPSMPAVAAPECPDSLKGIAREEWVRICAELHELKVLSRAERGSLEQYCETYAKWRECCETLKTEDQWIPLKSGGISEHPAGKAQRALSLMCHKFLSDFGMTPVSRTRLVITEGTNGNDQAKRFFGKAE